MAIMYWKPVKIVDYYKEPDSQRNLQIIAVIENVDGSPFPCGLFKIKRYAVTLGEDEPGEIQKAIKELANKQVGG